MVVFPDPEGAENMMSFPFGMRKDKFILTDCLPCIRNMAAAVAHCGLFAGHPRVKVYIGKLVGTLESHQLQEVLLSAGAPACQIGERDHNP